MLGSAVSMRHRIEKNVDPQGIAVARELVEILRVLCFPLPRVRHVGVVRHYGDDLAVPVANRPEVRHGRFCTALGCGTSADGTPETDTGDLRNLLYLDHRMKNWIAERHVF